MRVLRSEKNPFRPYLASQRMNNCRYFWADEEPYYVSHHHKKLLIQEQGSARIINRPVRHKLQRQKAMVDGTIINGSVERDISPLNKNIDEETFFYNW